MGTRTTGYRSTHCFICSFIPQEFNLHYDLQETTTNELNATTQKKIGKS